MMSENVLAASRKYTARGWVVHPLSQPVKGNKDTGKTPLISKWQKLKPAADEKLVEWFEKTKNNVGIVCGKTSGIIVVDFDKLDWVASLIPPKEYDISKTLMAGRTAGRGHIYFKHDADQKNLKLHDMGIEILSDGSNCVLPPSIHYKDLEEYKWKHEGIEPQPLPKIIKENLPLLKSFDGKTKTCRPCVRWVIFKSNDAMHGNDGRRLMLFISTELKANKVTDAEILLYAHKVYGDGYDPERTLKEYHNCDENKPWKCDTIRENFPVLAAMCSTCPIKQLDKDYIDVETKEKALDILQNGDPIQYVLDAWNKIHVSDMSFGFTLMCSSLSASIVNSDGIQINFNGDSGGGKSHACRSMLHLIPKKYWSKKSLSNKALFYTNSIKPGMILFSDDVDMSDDLKTVYKNSVSDFQEEVEHETVDIQRKAVTLSVPSQITWWLTSVTDPGNNEIERRNLKIVIDVNPKRYDSISERLRLRKCQGEAKYPEYPEVIICRAIFDNIKSGKDRIVIPYRIKFSDKVGLDTQNIIYEMIFSTTLINKYKRQKTEDGAIISTSEDFELVIDHFSHISDTQVSKLTKGELQVALYMKAQAKMSPLSSVTSEDLQRKFEKSKGWVSQIFNGKNGDGGLLQKLPNVVEDDVSKKDGDESSTRRKEYRFMGDWNELSLYESIAHIVKDGDVVVALGSP